MFKEILKGIKNIFKSSEADFDPTITQSGRSQYEYQNTGLESRMRDMEPEKQFDMPSYEIAERTELSQDQLPIDDIGGTRKLKRW